MDYILAGLIVLLLVKSYLDDQENRRERDKLTRALMAKNLQEYSASEILKEEPKEEELPDAVPTEVADEEIFNKHLENLVKNNG